MLVLFSYCKFNKQKIFPRMGVQFHSMISCHYLVLLYLQTDGRIKCIIVAYIIISIPRIFMHFYAFQRIQNVNRNFVPPCIFYIFSHVTRIVRIFAPLNIPRTNKTLSLNPTQCTVKYTENERCLQLWRRMYILSSKLLKIQSLVAE